MACRRRRVRSWVLWGLVYLASVVAGWGWLMVCWSMFSMLLVSVLSADGEWACSCSAGARMPVAEWGRVVPARWTCSAVATRGSVDAFPGAVLVGVETVADRLGLVRRVECLGQSEARRSPLSSDSCDRLGLGQGGPVADGAGTARRGRSGAPGPSGRRPRAGAGQRPADRPDPELLTYGSRCTGRSAGRAPALRRDGQANALFQDRAGSSQLADLLFTLLDPLGVLATW